MNSISNYIRMGKKNEEYGLNKLFHRFRSKMIGWARKELNPAKCRAFDAEDMALEAYHSLC